MIVRNDGSDLLFITQCDHAALSARVLAAMQRRDWLIRPTREAVLFATHHHDDGWREEDARPTVDVLTQRPFDFMSLPVLRRQAVWPRAVARLGATSSYAAALLAQHAITVFRRYRSDPEWREFLGRMEDARNQHYSRAWQPDFVPTVLDPEPASRSLLLQDYGFLAWADLASLVFCHGWTETLEVDVFRLRGSGSRVLISPDPFAGRSVPLHVQARRVRAADCSSSDTLASALAAAAWEPLSGVATGAAALD